MCALIRLGELHVANNVLAGLPLEIGYLTSLERLHVQKNKIKELPEVSKDVCIDQGGTYRNNYILVID